MVTRQVPHDRQEAVDDEVPPSAWVIGVAVVYVPMTLFCVGWVGWTSGLEEVIARTGFRVSAVILGLGAGVSVVLGSVALIRFTKMGQQMGLALAEMLGQQPLLVCVWMALFSAVGEEWLFRGLLQPWLGAVWATVLFACAHVPMERRLWLWPVFALVAGGGFAWLYDTTGGLTAPVTAHFIINAANLYWVGRTHWWRR